MELRKQDKPTITPSGKNNSKGIKAYDAVLKNLKRKTDITATAQHNFGFYSFIQSLSEIS